MLREGRDIIESNFFLVPLAQLLVLLLGTLVLRAKVQVLVGPYSINDLISTLTSTRVWSQHRTGTQRQKSANGSRAGKAGQQLWTHQSWVHGGTLMYPPTCPPTRMLRHHVSPECKLTSVTPSHQTIQPHLPTTREGPSSGASFALVSFTLVSFALVSFTLL